MMMRKVHFLNQPDQYLRYYLKHLQVVIHQPLVVDQQWRSFEFKCERLLAIQVAVVLTVTMVIEINNSYHFFISLIVNIFFCSVVILYLLIGSILLLFLDMVHCILMIGSLLSASNRHCTLMGI